jgi:hypothetical protein
LLQDNDANDQDFRNYSALKNVKVQDLSLIVTMGYDEVRFFLPNVADEFIETIAIVIVVFHEFGPCLQQ